jgi:hypothetical protein
MGLLSRLAGPHGLVQYCFIPALPSMEPKTYQGTSPTQQHLLRGRLAEAKPPRAGAFPTPLLTRSFRRFYYVVPSKKNGFYYVVTNLRYEVKRVPLARSTNTTKSRCPSTNSKATIQQGRSLKVTRSRKYLLPPYRRPLSRDGPGRNPGWHFELRSFLALAVSPDRTHRSATSDASYVYFRSLD